jgi:hypothetical protein
MAQGIVPLTFLEPDDYQKLPPGSVLELPDIRDALGRGESTCRLVVLEKGVEARVACSFSAREREVVLAGGLLAHLRGGGGSFGIHLGHSGAADQGSPVTNPVQDVLD